MKVKNKKQYERQLGRNEALKTLAKIHKHRHNQRKCNSLLSTEISKAIIKSTHYKHGFFDVMSDFISQSFEGAPDLSALIEENESKQETQSNKKFSASVALMLAA